MAEASPILQYIQETLGAKVLATLEPQGDSVVILSREGLRESFRVFKEHPQLGFDLLSDITAVDYWQKKNPRFEVVYQLAFP